MQLTYTSEEILADHEYAKPHVVAGRTLHGGFDADGVYRSPRTLHRKPAIESWAAALRERDAAPLEIGLDLLSGPRYPNAAQHKFLLQHDLGETLWNSLTSIGRTEASGASLAGMVPPPFEDVVPDLDLETATIGHLRPLFIAHGRDEGGIPAEGIGGHDEMWFVARDLAFGEGRYPLPPVVQRGRRPGADQRWMPELPEPHEQLLRSLLGLLLIEIGAFVTFHVNEGLLRDPELFTERRKQAEEAADVVARIREDERAHVGYLCNLFGELRHSEIRCVDGSRKPGSEIIDPVWQRQIQMQRRLFPRQQRAEMRKAVHERIGAHPDGDRLLEKFEALTDPGAFD